jgi:tetratricopeptide (TPR) repeat protein
MGDVLDVLLDDAEARLARRDFRSAHTICLDVLKRDPRRARGYQLLGVIAAEHDNHAKALEVLDRAKALAPNDPRTDAFRGRSLVALSRLNEARAAAEAAAARDPKDAHTLDTIGVVFARTGDHARAVEQFRKAAQREPGNASYAYNLGAAEQFVGDFAAAEAAYRATLAIDANHYKARSGLVGLKRQTREANDLNALLALFTSHGTSPDAALHIGHALAKSYEDMGDYERALKWLDRAKAPRRAALGPREDDKALFAAAARTADAPAPKRPGGSGAAIFVVGLPRTGTTLVDRILSSHPDVVSAGELTDFAVLVKRAVGTPGARVLDAATLDAAAAVDLAPIGDSYEASARRVVGDAPRFVDKMPLNFFYAALILKALPDARIVRLRRDPMDAAISNYRQLFGLGFSYYDYAYDLAETGRYVVAFERLMARWREKLPKERYIEVGYEDLVTDLEGQARRLLEFCALPWNDRVLKFYENDAPVATASSVQVRAPIHNRSVGRWKRYGEGIAPLKKIIEDAGLGGG